MTINEAFAPLSKCTTDGVDQKGDDKGRKPPPPAGPLLQKQGVHISWLSSVSLHPP